MLVKHGNLLIKISRLEDLGGGWLKISGHAQDKSGRTTLYDRVLVRADALEIVSASESERIIIERAKNRIEPDRNASQIQKTTSQPLQFWKITLSKHDLENIPGEIIGWSVEYASLYETSSSIFRYLEKRESEAEILGVNLSDGVIYCEAPNRPQSVRAKFIIGGEAWWKSIQINNVERIPEVME